MRRRKLPGRPALASDAGRPRADHGETPQQSRLQTTPSRRVCQPRLRHRQTPNPSQLRHQTPIGIWPNLTMRQTLAPELQQQSSWNSTPNAGLLLGAPFRPRDRRLLVPVLLSKKRFAHSYLLATLKSMKPKISPTTAHSSDAALQHQLKLWVAMCLHGIPNEASESHQKAFVETQRSPMFRRHNARLSAYCF